MPEEHAFLSASGAHRWINCTPSAALEKQFPDTAGSYAAEGTLAHSLAELKLRKQFEIMKPSAYKQRLAEIQSDELYQREMDGYTDAYVDYIRSLCMAFAGTPYVVVEKRLDFSQIVPGGFGTGDCVILYDDTLHIVDLKYECRRRTTRSCGCTPSVPCRSTVCCTRSDRCRCTLYSHGSTTSPQTV